MSPAMLRTDDSMLQWICVDATSLGSTVTRRERRVDFRIDRMGLGICSLPKRRQFIAPEVSEVPGGKPFLRQAPQSQPLRT